MHYNLLGYMNIRTYVHSFDLFTNAPVGFIPTYIWFATSVATFPMQVLCVKIYVDISFYITLRALILEGVGRETHLKYNTIFILNPENRLQ